MFFPPNGMSQNESRKPLRSKPPEGEEVSKESLQYLWGHEPMNQWVTSQWVHELVQLPKPIEQFSNDCRK